MQAHCICRTSSCLPALRLRHHQQKFGFVRFDGFVRFHEFKSVTDGATACFLNLRNLSNPSNQPICVPFVQFVYAMLFNI